MNNTQKPLSKILKETTEDLLSEESLTQIEEAIDQKVNEKLDLHLTKALTEQDEEYSQKLETLLEAIDKDHTSKMKKIVEALDKNNAEKLAKVIKRFNVALNESAQNFKKNTIGHISDYLDLYVEETIPTESIMEAVKNKKAMGLISELRKTLGVDAALSRDSIKAAIRDGHKQIVEASQKLEAAENRVAVLTEQVESTSRDLILEQKTRDLDPKRAGYIKKMMEGKSSAFITENFDYALDMFDKNEGKRLQGLRKEAKNSMNSVDRPAREVISESVDSKKTAPKPASMGDSYLNELSKY